MLLEKHMHHVFWRDQRVTCDGCVFESFLMSKALHVDIFQGVIS
jgi:hypothetical protein